MHENGMIAVLLHFLISLLLLHGTNRLAGYPAAGKGLLAAAALNGLYGWSCMVPGLRFLGSGYWRVVFHVLIATMAFGFTVSAWKRAGIYILLRMALWGIAAKLGRSDVLGLLGAAILLWLLCPISFGPGIRGSAFLPVEIRSGNTRIRLIALVDTGNMLRDPVSGEQVLVIDRDAAMSLTGLSDVSLADPLGNVGRIPGLRLIPYHTAGQAQGFFLGKRFDEVHIGKWKGSAMVAFSPQVIGRGEGYRALTGGKQW